MKIFTDGSCDNKGNGAYGVVILFKNKVTEYSSKCFQNVTNNQMELRAIITALKIIKNNEQNIKEEVIIYSDSEYCVNSINKWLKIWIKNNYNIGSNKEIKNIPLWKEFTQLRDSLKINIKYEWVKGHVDNEFNNIADRNAVKARKENYLKAIINTYEKE